MVKYSKIFFIGVVYSLSWKHCTNHGCCPSNVQSVVYFQVYTPRSHIKCVYCSSEILLSEVADHRYFCDSIGEDASTSSDGERLHGGGQLGDSGSDDRTGASAQGGRVGSASGSSDRGESGRDQRGDESMPGNDGGGGGSVNEVEETAQSPPLFSDDSQGGNSVSSTRSEDAYEVLVSPPPTQGNPPLTEGSSNRPRRSLRLARNSSQTPMFQEVRNLPTDNG